MKKMPLLVLTLLCACDREAQDRSAAPAASVPKEIVATPTAQSSAPMVIAMPKDQAEIDRMILAGYMPHGNHLHPPGMKKCPLEQQGNAAVM